MSNNFSDWQSIGTVETDFKEIDADNKVIWEKPRLPSAYQECEWIESSGTQYIDTYYIPTQNTGFEITYITKNQIDPYSGYGAVLGARMSDKNKELELTSFIPAGGVGGTLRYGTTETSNLGMVTNTKITHKLINKVFTKPDGTTFTVSSRVFLAPYYLTLFALNENNSITQYGSVRIYSCKIYNGSTVVREFVPCYRKSDSVIGLYDLVNEVFYDNEGTGTFTKGADV